MHTYSTELRMKRKAAGLSLSDIDYVAKRTKRAMISRIEKGKTLPNVEILLTYHLLFDIPLTSLLEKYREDVITSLQERLPVLLTYLKQQEQTERIRLRIQHVENSITRLALNV